jgi:hypothetical protein
MLAVTNADHATPLYAQKLALNFANKWWSSVGVVHSRTRVYRVFFTRKMCVSMLKTSLDMEFFVGLLCECSRKNNFASMFCIMTGIPIDICRIIILSLNSNGKSLYGQSVGVDHELLISMETWKFNPKLAIWGNYFLFWFIHRRLIWNTYVALWPQKSIQHSSCEPATSCSDALPRGSTAQRGTSRAMKRKEDERSLQNICTCWRRAACPSHSQYDS